MTLDDIINGLVIGIIITLLLGIAAVPVIALALGIE